MDASFSVKHKVYFKRGRSETALLWKGSETGEILFLSGLREGFGAAEQCCSTALPLCWANKVLQGIFAKKLA